MTLDWLPRTHTLVDHSLDGEVYFRSEPPGVIYEKKPIIDPDEFPSQPADSPVHR